jgi:DNA-binding NarL/FixJ family response regulator
MTDCRGTVDLLSVAAEADEHGSKAGEFDAPRGSRLKILIIDDHPMVRDAMSHLVSQLDLTVEVLEAGDCVSALALAADHPDLDLMLLDLNLPGLHGIPAVERLRKEYPAVPLVVVSALADRELVLNAINAGAMGFIPKSSEQHTVVGALREVLNGSIFVPHWMTDRSCHASFDRGAPSLPIDGRDVARLTARQRQVLALLMRGCSNKDICRELGLAERTVKIHLTAVLNALKVSSRTQAVIAAHQLGLDADELLRSGGAESGR